MCQIKAKIENLKSETSQRKIMVLGQDFKCCVYVFQVVDKVL